MPTRGRHAVAVFLSFLPPSFSFFFSACTHTRVSTTNYRPADDRRSLSPSCDRTLFVIHMPLSFSLPHLLSLSPLRSIARHRVPNFFPPFFFVILYTRESPIKFDSEITCRHKSRYARCVPSLYDTKRHVIVITIKIIITHELFARYIDRLDWPMARGRAA